MILTPTVLLSGRCSLVPRYEFRFELLSSSSMQPGEVGQSHVVWDADNILDELSSRGDSEFERTTMMIMMTSVK